ncbi:MAG TPA: hypothetical protein PKO06_15530, partial [Candidatus Ozemobacteraceae bacterium]|nr:hypothetical protein [Candidatus Ozemobacteraceae bacterium]
MKNASTVAGWVIFVLLPPLLMAWALDTSLTLNRESELRRSREFLSRFARTTLAQATPRTFVRRAFQQGTPPTWSAPALAFEAGRPGSGSTPLLDEISGHLQAGTFPTPERYDVWRHQIGWEFDFHRFRSHPGVPQAVRWGRQEAWLVWKPLATTSVRLALYVVPPLVERILTSMPEHAMEQRLAWAIAYPEAKRWRARAPFRPRVIRPMLTALKGGVATTRRTATHLYYAESLEQNLVLMLQKPFSGWYVHTTRRLLWSFCLGLLAALSIAYPYLVRRVPAWPLKIKFLGIFAYLVGLPLAGVAIFAMAVTSDRLHLKQTELRRLARSELLRFDDGLREEIRATQLFFRSIPNHPALQQRRL